MALTAEQTQEILDLRKKEAQGVLTLEDCRRIVPLLRQGRVAAQYASTASKTKKAAAAPKDVSALLAGLMKSTGDTASGSGVAPVPAQATNLGTKL